VLTKKEQGLQGENKALKILKKQGYAILERNYRCPFGEIDIIAEEDGCLVFVEVKMRNTSTFGSPFDAITARKKKHIIQSALFYMKTHKHPHKKMRFDMLGITPDNTKLIKNAFISEQKI
jgi:putative endonuclease